MINGGHFFDEPINDNKVTYEDIRKIATGKGDDYNMRIYLILEEAKETILNFAEGTVKVF